MRILLLTHAFNSLTQRIYVALKERGHEVTVEFDVKDSVSIEAVNLFKPDVIIAPFMKRAIPEEIWKNHLTLVVHPGIKGDRGPAALDWAVLEEQTEWGMTLLQAVEEMDAGDIWESLTFPMRAAPKASLYRREISALAEAAVIKAIENIEAGDFKPEPLNYDNADVKGKLKPVCKQADRAIDWQKDSAAEIIKKINSADGFPGLRSRLFDEDVSLFDAHVENTLTGKPGQPIAKKETAVCVGTSDGAVWIGHVVRREQEPVLKLPTTLAFADKCQDLPEAGDWTDIWYETRNGVGYLHFPFYNGAMSTDQCQRLTTALTDAKKSPEKVICLMGGKDFWSNGIHLNVIEQADSPADESWANINAIDDFVKEVIETTNKMTIAAIQGNAGAGGVFMALAADKVLARDGVILNPHYKGMGNLFGSEYWTYLLPKRSNEEAAHRITQARLPMGVREAKELGLVDDFMSGDSDQFVQDLETFAERLAADKGLDQMIADKAQARIKDEAEKPLADYRAEELSKMKLNFYGFDPSYHVARYNFVFKVPKSRTPLTIATHRRSVKRQKDGGLAAE